MGSLLGEHDRHLRRIEEALPEADITVRGNEVHVSGPDASVAATLFEELVVLAERGQRVDERTLDRTIDMVRADEKPSSVFTHDILRRQGAGDPAEVGGSEGVRRGDRGQRGHLRHWSCGYR